MSWRGIVDIERADVRMGPNPEVLLVEIGEPLVNFAGEDAPVTEAGQSQVESAKAGEKIDKAKRLRGLPLPGSARAAPLSCSHGRRSGA